MDGLRNAGEDEFNRRLSLEATLQQAAALFKRELASKSDEVAALQGQLRGMRHELASSNACSAAAVAAAGAARQAAAAACGSCSSSPAASPGGCHASPGAAAAAAAAVAAAGLGPRSAACSSCYPAAAGVGCSDHTAAVPPAQGGDSGAAAVAAELQALRASRVSYQNALLQQQAMRNSLLSSLGDCLEVSQ